MAKQTIEHFLVELLKEAGCKGIEAHKDSITCQCPFHWNRNNFKTFRVSTKEVRHQETGIKNYYFNCFSCHNSGTIPKLVSHIYKCSYKKGLKLFQKRTNVNKITIDKLQKELSELQDAQDKKLEEINLPPSSKNQEPMYEFFNRRWKMYHRVLDIDYIVNKYSLYYCSNGRMAGRIIMPVRDTDGTVVGYNDRSVNFNSKIKSLHPKGISYGKMLHGYYENRGKRYGVLTEGAFDMFAVDSVLHKHKRLNKKYGVVNMMGTAFTDERFSLMLNGFDEICLMFDYDKAGLKAKKQIEETYQNDAILHNCTENYPELKDPGKCTEEEIVTALTKPVKKKKRSYLKHIIEDLGFNVGIV